MRITKRGDYAIRSMVYLAKNRNGKNYSNARDIAKEADIPSQFLPQIIRDLSRGNLVNCLRGPNGGCKLARKPEEISLLEIVEAVEGPIAIVQCLDVFNPCVRVNSCKVFPFFEKAQVALIKSLKKATLKQIIES